MCDAVNPLPVREQGNDENEYHKDKDWGEHVLCRGKRRHVREKGTASKGSSRGLDSPWHNT